MITIEYISKGYTKTLTFEDSDSAAEWYLNEKHDGPLTFYGGARWERALFWQLVEEEMHK
jgi:hypothetical protein